MMLPKRKAARLKGYDYCQPGAYFVTICAKGRRCLFGSIPPSSVGVDASIDPRAGVPVVLSPLGRTVQKYQQMIPGVTAYVLMPNHLHCLIVIPGSGIGPYNFPESPHLQGARSARDGLLCFSALLL